MKKRLLSLALSLALCMGLAVPALAEEETGGAGGDSETTVPVESVTLSGDGLENGTLETGTGVYFTLTATVMPENATDKTVIWTSGDDEIATVEDGIVTGLSVGETTVTATAGGKSATCTVKVTEEFGTDAGEKVTITFQNEGGATIYFGDSSEGSSESVVQIEIDKGGEFHFALDAPEGKKIDSVSVEGGDTLTAESIYYDLENITTDTTIIITLADDPSDTTKKTPTVSGNTVSVLVGSNARIVVETDGTVDAYILGNTSTAPVTQDGVAAVSVSGNIVAAAGIGAGTTHVYINTTETETYSAGYFPITVTVTAPPTNPGGGNGSSGGGSSSGGSSSSGSSNTSTTTTRNPDGSTTTKTENRRTGTVTETTTHRDGSKTVVETKKDGSRTTTMENASGTQSTTQVSASGKTEVWATVPAAAVTNASGAAVAIPMPEVAVVWNTSSAPPITVTTGSTSPVRVEVPVRNATIATVAVVVHADGTEQVIKSSLITDNGVSVPVGNGETIKIVDNAKAFTDTGSHWASEAISFVSAREIFSGVSAGRFSPDSNLTRAQLATVLARFDGVDTRGGATWYEKSVEWAVQKGVSDGSNPGGNISREQLVSMLWRYAGSPSSGGSLSGFSDAGTVSGYAQQALVWAVENGIISGYDGRISPQGNATRAQVASIMQRYLYNIA